MIDGFPAIIDSLGGSGIEPSEIFLEAIRTVSLTSEDGRLRPPRVGSDAGSSVRLWTADGDRFACQSGIGERSIRECVAILGGNPERITGRLGLPEEAVRSEADGDLRIGSPDLRRRVIGWLRESEKAACEGLPGVVSCSSGFREIFRRVWIFLPDGTVKTRSFRWAHLGITAAARWKGSKHKGSFRADGEDPEHLLRTEAPSRCGEAARQDLLESGESAQEISGLMPVVFSAPAAGTFFHEVCGHLLEGDVAGDPGGGLLPGGSGRIPASGLTVIDDPTVPGFGGSAGVDDEGTPCRRIPLIEEGRVVGRLLDRRNARLRGTESTGSGRRASFRDRPLPRLGNLFIAGGREGAGEAVGTCRDGLLIEELVAGRVDPYNGEFHLVGNRGYLLRRGKKDRPIRGLQISGRAVEALDGIEVLEEEAAAVGTTGGCLKEGQSLLTGLCSPPVRIRGLAVRTGRA